ncbi:MAG: hypothetical protein ABIS86_15300 [Streptosporangiaceae bacterium]
MGFIKQWKQLAGVANEMPAMMNQAQQLQAQAAQMQAGQYGMIPQPTAPADNDPRMLPIEGVSLPLYAQISKVAATRGLDVAGLAAHVAALGHDPAAWTRATEGWNARFKGDMALATLFGRLYQEAKV